MAIDFGKYGAPIAVDPKTKQPLDFAKYGQPTRQLPAASAQQPKFNVAETRQQKISRLKTEGAKKELEADKTESFVEKYVKPIGGAIFPGAVTLGESIASGEKVKMNQEDYQHTIQTTAEQQIKLLRMINENKASGKSTTNLERLYNEGVDKLQNLKGEFEKETAGAERTTKELAGDIAMTAADVLTAGTYGKAATGMSMFKLGKEMPTAISKTTGLFTKPAGLFTRQGAKDVALGAGIGETYDIAQNLRENKEGADIVTDGFAKYIGAAIPMVTRGGQGITGKFKQDKIREDLGNAIRETAGKYTRSQAIIERAETVHGTDPVSLFKLYGGKMVPDMTPNGRVNPGEQIDFLSAKIKELSELKKEALFLSDQVVPVDEFIKYTNNLIDAQNWTAAKKATEKNDVSRILENIKAAQKDQPFELNILDQIKTEQTSLSKSYSNPKAAFSYDAHGVVGKAARDLVEMFSDDIAVKDLNKFIQGHYDAIDLLNSWKGKTPKGGMMAKHFSRVTGQVLGYSAGSAAGHPFAGAIAGNVLSDQIADIVQSNFITNPVKRLLIDNLKEQQPAQVSKILKTLESKYNDIFQDLGLSAQSSTMRSAQYRSLSDSNLGSSQNKATNLANQNKSILQSESKNSGMANNANTTSIINDNTGNFSENQALPDESYIKQGLREGKELAQILIDFVKNPKAGMSIEDVSKKAINLADSELTKRIDILSKRGFKPTGEPIGWTLENGVQHVEINLKNAQGQEMNIYVRSNGDKTLAKVDLSPLSKKPSADFGTDPFKGTELAMDSKITSPKAYKDSGALTTKLLSKLEGRTTVSKQFISDLTNSPDMKQVERDLIRKSLAGEADVVDVNKFVNKVKDELLPLKINRSGKYSDSGRIERYESITLPKEIRGKVFDYEERIYESPIKTSAGEVHFGFRGSMKGIPRNYFGHTRIEDMVDKSTRRVIEVQSDLYQKGRLEAELENNKSYLDLVHQRNGLRPDGTPIGKESIDKANRFIKDANKLQQYNDPTAHFRMVREEVKQAAIDGKTKLQFPTGETAMKIEGLSGGSDNMWFTDANNNQMLIQEGLKPGKQIYQYEHPWIITDILGDGKFKALPKETYDKVWKEYKANPSKYEHPTRQNNYIQEQETFDISGKVDTSNPIYKFYEKDLGRYLVNKYGAKTVVDPQGVKWYEVDIKKEYKDMPVEAFGAGLLSLGINNDDE